MFVDYYDLLGVQPDASTEAILSAYRRAAARYHPDRGGSHEKMVLVNEAWAILSDPRSRSEYDQVLAKRMDNERLSAWMNQTQDLRERAQQYPRQWGEFEKWMEGFAADVVSARYGSTRVFPGVVLPTAGASLSGLAFIGVGALIVFLLCYCLLPPYHMVFARVFLNELPDRTTLLGNIIARLPGLVLIVLSCAPIAGGAWLGAMIHAGLREGLLQSRKREETVQQPPAPNKHQPIADSFDVLICDVCGRKLRVPKLHKELAVTCPSCKNKFEYHS